MWTTELKANEELVIDDSTVIVFERRTRIFVTGDKKHKLTKRAACRIPDVSSTERDGAA